MEISHCVFSVSHSLLYDKYNIFKIIWKNIFIQTFYKHFHQDESQTMYNILAFTSVLHKIDNCTHACIRLLLSCAVKQYGIWYSFSCASSCPESFGEPRMTFNYRWQARVRLCENFLNSHVPDNENRSYMRVDESDWIWPSVAKTLIKILTSSRLMRVYESRLDLQ
jgi:hypothetical protein